MTKKPEAMKPMEEVEEQSQPQEVPGIFITKEKVHNMDVERILVAGFAIKDILERTKLTVKAQEEAVDRLVERTPMFFSMEPEEVHEKIKIALTEETVVEYLRHEGIIRKKADMVEVGVDKEGSLVVTAFYTNVPREIRRAIQKQVSKKEMARMDKAVNILSGDNNLIDLAQKKLEKLKKEGK